MDCITRLENLSGMERSWGSMTKSAALYNFFSSFEIPAYVDTNVPEDATFPYLTYNNVIDSLSGGDVALTVNLWYLTTSEKLPNDKAEEIAERIGYGGTTLECDGGYIWLKRGSPWCQSLTDTTDIRIKRRYINVTAEYITEN